MLWTVYLVRCADDSLYCGITNDLPARLAAHAAGKGAKYTRGRGPFRLVAMQRTRDKRVALRIEHAVKKLARPQKLRLDAAKLAALAAVARRKLRDTRGDDLAEHPGSRSRGLARGRRGTSAVRQHRR